MLMETTIKMDDNTEKKIGIFDTEKKLWYIRRDEKKHFMRKLKSWGLDNKMYEILKSNHGLKGIILNEMNSLKRYICPLEDIETNKIFKYFKPHRLQIFIPKKHWKKLKDNEEYVIIK